LVRESDNTPVKVGDKLKTFRDEQVTLMGWKFPYDPSDNLFAGGKIYCQAKGQSYQDQWFPNVCDLKFILVPDVPFVPAKDWDAAGDDVTKNSHFKPEPRWDDMAK
jgi:hypothetical protein